MGGFTPPIPQDDSDWEIRVAVLLSLLLQVFLIFFGPVRKRSSNPATRFLVWSCYLLADWVADLGLGLLLNNMGNIGGSHSSSSSSSSSGNSTSTFTTMHVTGKRGGNLPPSSSTDSGSSSPIIFAFWTPFLLLHLGGPDTITAYSLEDNELWLRHLIGLLFELFSASVIFFCSLKGNTMILATVVMFVVGILKYGERTYSLYSGSVDGFREKILDDPDPGPNYAKLMTEFDAKEKAGLSVQIVITGNDEDAKQALTALEEDETNRLVMNTNKSPEAQAFDFFRIFRRLFVNLILSDKERKTSQAYFLLRDDINFTNAFQVIEIELNFIYDMVYTKAPVAHSRFGLGYVLRFIGSACIVSALLIFFFHGKDDFLHIDVAITYALLIGGLALDAAALAMLLSSHRMLVSLEKTQRLAWLARAIRSTRPQLRRWSGRTSQLNLVSYCLGKPDPYRKGGLFRRYGSPKVIRALAKVAEKLHVREVFDDFFFIRRESLCSREGGEKNPHLEFIFEGLKKRAMEAKSKRYNNMKETCSSRGKGVLEGHRKEIEERLMEMTQQTREGKDDKVIKEKFEEKLAILMDSVDADKKEFDESLLLWHIATDLCGHTLNEKTVLNEDTEKNIKPIGETLSEYMLYLLIKQPEMLSATAGIGLLRYRDTCAEAKRFFESAAAYDPNHNDARRMLLKVNTTKKPSEVKGDRCKSVLFDAVILAKVLRELDAQLMWKVVANVWAEMLTYAAGKCRGSTHVRQLSRGGELITLVWFLMAHMGLGDMYQIHAGDAKAKLIVRDQ